MKPFVCILSVLAGIALLAEPAAAKPGDLDATFGTVGRAVEPFSGLDSEVRAMAVQPDGKILTVGWAGPHSGIDRDFAVERYLPDGTPDMDFGTGGSVTTHFEALDSAWCVALQADGKIVVAGTANEATQFDHVAVARYLPNGSLDTSFGTGGKVTRNSETNTQISGSSVAVLADGKILVSGWVNHLSGGTEDAYFYRFLGDGTPDESFGPDGQVSLRGVGVQRMAVQPDGKFLFSGSKYVSRWQTWVGRCLADGTLDPTFGQGGTFTAPPVAGGQALTAWLTLLRDGKTVVTSRRDLDIVLPVIRFAADVQVTRVDPDGNADVSFNGTGTVITGTSAFVPGNASFGEPHDSVEQSDGKLVVAGSLGGHFGLLRYLPGGSLDTSFNGTGAVTTQMGTGSSKIKAVALQRDGKILAAGTAFSGTRQIMALARYMASAPPAGIAAEWPAGTPLADGQTVHVGSVARALPGTPETMITLQNTGTATLTGLTARLTGVEAGHFEIMASPAPVLESGATTTLKVRFVPAPEVSSFAAALVIRTDDPAMLEFVIVVQGSTDQPVATLALFEGTAPLAQEALVDFGPAVAGLGVKRGFTIKSTGNIDLTLQGITLADSENPGDFTIHAPEAEVLPPDASTPFTVTFSPQGSGIRNARLRIASTDSFNPPLEIDLTGKLAAGINAWRQAYFGSTNAGPASDLSDPDNDGIPNLLEYATLTNPKESNAPAGVLAKNGNMLEYTLTRPSGALADLTYALEWSESPIDSWSSAGVAAYVLSDDGAHQTMKFSVPAGEGRRFVRLRVTRN